MKLLRNCWWTTSSCRLTVPKLLFGLQVFLMWWASDFAPTWTCHDLDLWSWNFSNLKQSFLPIKSLKSIQRIEIFLKVIYPLIWSCLDPDLKTVFFLISWISKSLIGDFGKMDKRNTIIRRQKKKLTILLYLCQKWTDFDDQSTKIFRI